MSSVKSLCIVPIPGQPGAVHLLSAGGRAQIKIWSLSLIQDDDDDDDDGQLMANELDTFMLLGCDKAVRRPWKATANGMRPDPETRFLSLAADGGLSSRGKLGIFVSCSDAALRIFSYVSGEKLELVNELSWQEHCLLQVRHMRLKQDTRCLLMTTTGGRIYGLVEPTKEDQLQQPPALDFLQAHQSGINAIDVTTDKTGSGLILTGGDDNSLQLTEVRLQGGALHFTSLWRCLAAHAAQVTGVKLRGKMYWYFPLHYFITVQDIFLVFS